MKHLTDKEPWQMTRNEYIKMGASKTGLSKSEFEDLMIWRLGGGEPRGGSLNYSKLHKMDLAYRDYKKGWTYTTSKGSALIDSVGGKHKDIIKQALSEGKPVPHEVLEDYPDLQYEKGFKEVFPKGVPTPTRKQMESNPGGKMAHLRTKKPIHNFKLGDIVIYSDFGLRSLLIVEVLEWPSTESKIVGQSVQVGPIHLGGVQHDIETSVYCKSLSDLLLDWDFEKTSYREHYKPGTTHFINYTNLYRKLDDIIAKEKRILYPEVLAGELERLKKHSGYVALKHFGVL